VTEPIRVGPTSADSAEGLEPVVLWTSPNSRRRLAFCPNVHNNPSCAGACVSGELRYQSKRAADDFVDDDSLSLNNLHAGEWTRCSLPSEALLELYRVLDGLYEMHAADGVPKRQYLLVPVDREEGDPAPSAEAIADVIRWLRASADPAGLAGVLTRLDPCSAQHFHAASAAGALSNLLAEWDGLASGPEPDWHRLLAGHEWVVQQVLGQPLVLFRDEAVVSSPTVDRKKTAYVDFMFRNPHTAAIALVEIKRADSALVQDRAYRGDAYAPSDELAAGVAQVQYYRATFQRDIETLLRDEQYLPLASPRCVLIIGDTDRLDTDFKRSSFERFRSGLQDVQVIAFNELRSRVESFLAVVTSDQSFRGSNG